jgi:hypothetical protein
MDVINPIPALLPGLRDAALRGTLIRFVGAGASRLAGCPNWTEFADRALRYFVDQGKFSHGQLAQLSQQPPRVKLSIALGLQSQHKLAINFDALYPEGRNTNPKGRHDGPDLLPWRVLAASPRGPPLSPSEPRMSPTKFLARRQALVSVVFHLISF